MVLFSGQENKTIHRVPTRIAEQYFGIGTLRKCKYSFRHRNLNSSILVMLTQSQIAI